MRFLHRSPSSFALRATEDNVAIVAQDERISDKSSAVREHYARKGITLDAGDCVHLATAILYKADVFFTLDGSGQPPKPNSLLNWMVMWPDTR